MSVRLRLRREGTKKKPHYRIVAADRRSPRDGRFIEIIGTYDPQQEPSHIEVDAERALYWLRNGAQPTNQVENLLAITGVWEQFKPGAAEEKRQRAEERAKQRAQRAEQKAAEQAAQQAAGGDAPAEQNPVAPEDLEQPETESADAVAETDASAAPQGGPGEGVEPGGSAPEQTPAEATSEAGTAEEDESA